MKIEEIATIIEESSREIAKEEDECCEPDGTGRKFIINTMSHLIDDEIFKLGKLVFELGDIAFSDEEVSVEEDSAVETAFYEKTNEADKHLNAIRKFAEMKRYFEAQGWGELQEKSVL